MKKLVSLLLAVCTCLSVGVTLTACEEEHAHTYETEWAHDDTHHWHECEGENCAEVSDKAEHSYGNWSLADNSQHKKVCECGAEIFEDHAWNDGEITTQPSASADGVKTFTCTACGQTKTESVAYAPTEAEIWQNAFDNSKITNCTVRLEDPSNGTVVYKVATVDGDRVVHISNNASMNYYLVYTADGKYIAYMKNGEAWAKQEFDQMINVFEMWSSYAAVCPNFGAYFSKFEYDEATESYIFSGVEDSDEIQTNDIMTTSTAKYYNAVVKIVDGKLVQVTSKMSGQSGKTDTVYFENYGTTTIELPTVSE